ncbi:transcriptional regulator [Pontiella sp.]|uniref:transcriptional regulator n=1 Tax=Pontiella sp. TaxID=2837462 RepID=UPI0035628998
MSKHENVFQALEKIFHEPSRLAIMSALCTAADGMTFSELKTECSLTDGNLNRHLKVLKESKVVSVKKAFVDDKPRTTVTITTKGLDRFNDYLEALADVMKQARKALPKTKPATLPATGKTATT